MRIRDWSSDFCSSDRVIPLYRVLSVLRHQAAAFAFDAALGDAEFVLVLDSPEQRDELHHVLGGLAALYGIGWRMLVHTANLGYAPAVNSGAGKIGRAHV